MDGLALWRFEPVSAIIGAVAAGLIAILIYGQRRRIRALASKLWSPVAEWQRRARSSEDEKYLAALRQRLKGLLLFAPEQPELVVQSPRYLAPPEIPNHLPDIEHLPTSFVVSHARLLDGHPRIVISGGLGSGKTTALASKVWEMPPLEAGGSLARLPVWIDLAQLRNLPASKRAAPLERFAELAALFLPVVRPHWLLSRLRKSPTLVLVDAWDRLALDERQTVATFLGQVAQELPESLWLVASEPVGYGSLVEQGFVPVELVPPTGRDVAAQLYAGWAKLLGKESGDAPDEVLDELELSMRAGALPLEMTLRAVVVAETGQHPKRPVDVVDFYLNQRIPMLDLGEGQEDVAEQARVIALRVLAQVGRAHRLERKVFTRQEIADLVAGTLPPAGERPSKLEGAVRKLVTESKLLRREGQYWQPAHYVWEEFFTAWLFSQDEGGGALLESHLFDPTWELILEFYAGLGDATDLVRALLRRAAESDDLSLLLRAARWAAVAPEDADWRALVLKALAQTFLRPEIARETRLDLGWAIAIDAPDMAREFFLQALRNPAHDIRCAALRGLGWSGSTREASILNGALGDKTHGVREAAVLALRDMGTPGAMRILSEAFAKADDRTALVIGQALAANPLGYEALANAAHDADLILRRAAAYGLGAVDETWAGELLTRLVREDGEWVVRSAAESALAQAEQGDAAKQVVLAPPRAEQTEWLVRWCAGQGTGLGVGDAALVQLARAVEEGDAEARVLGALTLMQIGHPEHVGVLEKLLGDGDPAVARAAAAAIRAIENRYPTPDSWLLAASD